MLQEGEESSGRTSSTQSSFLYIIRKKKLGEQARERKDPITPTLRGCVITGSPPRELLALSLDRFLLEGHYIIPNTRKRRKQPLITWEP